MEEQEVKKEEDLAKRLYTYPLVKQSDMEEEMQSEALDLCVTACEKYTNNEAAAKSIKEAMDKKYGPSWHAVVGKNFGMELTYKLQTLLYMFIGGTTAVCLWKCP